MDGDRPSDHQAGTASPPWLTWSNANPALTLQFLAWLADGPRAYGEMMAAWQTSCPRLAIWEDTLADGLVIVESGRGTPASDARVDITDRGRTVLESAART